MAIEASSFDINGSSLISPVGYKDLYLIRVMAETGSRLSHVVRNDEVKVFFRQFLPGMGYHIFRFSGKPH